MQQGQELGGSAPNVLMGLVSGIAFFLPGSAWLWDGLVRTGFIFTPDRNARFLG